MCSQEQEQVDDLKKKEAVLEKEKAEVLQQNKGLTEPLQEAQELVAELQKKLVHYYRDKEALMVSGQPFHGLIPGGKTPTSAAWCAVQVLFCLLCFCGISDGDPKRDWKGDQHHCRGVGVGAAWFSLCCSLSSLPRTHLQHFPDNLVG